MFPTFEDLDGASRMSASCCESDWSYLKLLGANERQQEREGGKAKFIEQQKSEGTPSGKMQTLLAQHVEGEVRQPCQTLLEFLPHTDRYLSKRDNDAVRNLIDLGGLSKTPAINRASGFQEISVNENALPFCNIQDIFHNLLAEDAHPMRCR